MTGPGRHWKLPSLATRGGSNSSRSSVRRMTRHLRSRSRHSSKVCPWKHWPGSLNEFRRNCLSELQHARQKKLLTEGSLSTQQLTAEAKGLLDADPHSLVQARWEGLRGVADELRQAGYSRLAWLIEHPPRAGSPLLVLAVRHFFRRQVHTQ